jgi:hypothetical protein
VQNRTPSAQALSKRGRREGGREGGRNSVYEKEESMSEQ